MSREVLNAEGLRTDGRRAGELRKLTLELDVMPYVDGSCRLTMGHTQVIATVVGPCDIKRFKSARGDEATVAVEYSIAPYAATEHRDTSRTTRTHKETALIIQQTFERAIQRHLFPQSHIQINVQVIHNAGGALACSINAVCAALLHAAVPMNDLVSAVTAAIVDTVPILDLNHIERMKAGSQLTLATNALSGEIVTMQSEQRISIDNLDTITQIAQQGCNRVAKIIRQHVREYLKEQIPG